MHELTHVLGFMSSSMTRWFNQTSNSIYNSADILKQVVNDPLFGNFTKLVTPEVLYNFRNYYNCPTIDGVPLENYPSSGTFGHHWESRLIR